MKIEVTLLTFEWVVAVRIPKPSRTVSLSQRPFGAITTVGRFS